MKIKLQVGDTVQATARICEPGFLGQDRFLHAAGGDEGIVQAVEADSVTVTWHRKGTTTDCPCECVERVTAPFQISDPTGI